MEIQEKRDSLGKKAKNGLGKFFEAEFGRQKCDIGLTILQIQYCREVLQVSIESTDQSGIIFDHSADPRPQWSTGERVSGLLQRTLKLYAPS